MLEARAVIGKPDALRGRMVQGLRGLATPASRADEALVVELQCHCKSLVAAYKYPRDRVHGRIPKTASGKTRHVALRERQRSRTGALLGSGAPTRPRA